MKRKIVLISVFLCLWTLLISGSALAADTVQVELSNGKTVTAYPLFRQDFSDNFQDYIPVYSEDKPDQVDGYVVNSWLTNQKTDFIYNVIPSESEDIHFFMLYDHLINEKTTEAYRETSLDKCRSSYIPGHYFGTFNSTVFNSHPIKGVGTFYVYSINENVNVQDLTFNIALDTGKQSIPAGFEEPTTTAYENVQPGDVRTFQFDWNVKNDGTFAYRRYRTDLEFTPVFYDYDGKKQVDVPEDVQATFKIEPIDNTDSEGYKLDQSSVTWNNNGKVSIPIRFFKVGTYKFKVSLVPSQSQNVNLNFERVDTLTVTFHVTTNGSHYGQGGYNIYDLRMDIVNNNGGQIKLREVDRRTEEEPTDPNPGNPDQPENKDPESPEQPDNDDENDPDLTDPSDPSDSQDPSNPSDPSGSDDPTTPSTPSPSPTPDTPTTPSVPSNPGTSSTPSTPSNPGVSTDNNQTSGSAGEDSTNTDESNGSSPDQTVTNPDNSENSSTGNNETGSSNGSQNNTEVSATTVYRIYNSISKEHLYTTDKVEYETLVNQGWNDEGTGWNSPQTGVPVYRLYSPVTGEHLYTLDLNEISVLTAAGTWTLDNNGEAVFYSGGKTPIYRSYHAGIQMHHLTTDHNEHQTITSNGWNDEGIAFYAN